MRELLAADYKLRAGAGVAGQSAAIRRLETEGEPGPACRSSGQDAYGVLQERAWPPSAKAAPDCTRFPFTLRYRLALAAFLQMHAAFTETLMLTRITNLLSRLSDACHFETAAFAALQSVLLLASEALAASDHTRNARVLRAGLHLRPEGAYQRLFILGREHARGSDEALTETGAGDPGDLRVSLTAWRMVAQHRRPVSIDVHDGTFQIHHPEGGVPGVGDKAGLGTFKSHESRQRYLGRQASHVHVVPLLAPGGAVEGMLSIEAECLAAVGQPLVWASSTASICLVVGIATPYLLTLPPRPGTTTRTDDFLPVLGAAMKAMVPILTVFAQQEETMLVSGPTGSGKSRLARWCHERSARRERKFETLDLMTIPEELQMAELFGWRKGAFTGATRDNLGAVARAEGGTLFIDEIDKLSLKAQAGLLHFLEERTYRLLGEGSDEHRADVRFLVGTNADLRAAVKAGRFREDLYFRINVLPVRMPALSDRIDEIPLWADYMLARRHREKHPDGSARISAAAKQRLAATPWPGNLRQLDNIVRRAYTLVLAEHGGTSRDVVLEDLHVMQGLAYDERPEKRSLGSAFQAAADAFVREAQRLPGGLDLDLADALKGFVIAIAIRELGREECFRIVGRESLVKNRNHHKTLRRELERAEALLRAVGEEHSLIAALQDADAGDA